MPFRVLVYLLCGRIGLTTLFGSGFSLLIEVSQFVFQLGFSDIDDFLLIRSVQQLERPSQLGLDRGLSGYGCHWLQYS